MSSRVGPITAEQRQAIEVMTAQIINKSAYPILELKDSSDEPQERESLRRTIRKIFGCDEPSPDRYPRSQLALWQDNEVARRLLERGYHRNHHCEDVRRQHADVALASVAGRVVIKSSRKRSIAGDRHGRDS